MRFKKFFIFAFFLVIIASLAALVLNYRSEIKISVDNTKNNIEDFQKRTIPQPTSTEQSGLPTYYLIKTAFVPQAPEKKWDQPWQDACEEASLLTVDYFYKNEKPDTLKIKQDILNMINYEQQQRWGVSINTSQMSQIAKDYLHYQPVFIENPTLTQIKTYVSKKIPIIVPAAGKILYKENKYFSNGGPYYHNLVILGFDDSKQQFITHDVGTQHGAYFHYSYALLMESIHDFPDSQNEKDIESGPKKILVLEK
jgi:hypothetical protein